MINKQTNLDLNGPILSFITQPSSVSICDGGTATFVGVATATFPIQIPANPATNTGFISYRWYDSNGPLSDGGNISGSATTTLTISNARTSSTQYYLVADYVPSAGIGGSTGNALNEPIRSNTATLTANPTISITQQPTSQISAQTNTTTFTAQAVANDGSPVSYQWQIDGRDITEDNTPLSNISQFFYTTTIINAYPGAGTVGSRSGFTNGDGTGGKNGFRYNAPDPSTNYFVELRATSNWNSTYNFVGVCDDAHWNDLSWPGTTGARMMWYVRHNFSYGEQTGSTITMSDNFQIYGTGVVTNDIVGIVVNQQQGSVNVYVNGNYICTIRNSRAAGRRLYVALSDWFNRIPVSCEMLTSPSTFSSSYFFPTSSSNQDLNAGTSTTITTTGVRTNTLQISSSRIVGSKVNCKVSHPTACNSPIYTSDANFTVVEPRSIANFEIIPFGSSSATLTSHDFSTNGSYTFSSFDTSFLSFYSPEKDIELFFDLYGGAGRNNGSFTGGQGGVSTIKLNLTKNVEYVLYGTTGGSAEPGSAIFLYRKASLIAAVGSGGNAGLSGNGGDGGGVNVAGASGSGRSPGIGGSLISQGTLPSNGIFGSITNNTASLRSGDSQAAIPLGGRVLPCTKGRYWANLGYSPCSDVGYVKFYLPQGIEVSNTTSSILRGFKDGYAIRSTAGGSDIPSSNGYGGHGATGGSGGLLSSGGGGGSGYSDGSVTVISTRQGGNTGSAKVVMRVGGSLAANFFTSNVINAYSGAGTVGSRSGFTNGDRTGATNGFRYDAPPAGQNYFMELRITNSNWRNSHGFVGVLDDTHWPVLNWTQNQGTRMMYYLGNNFSYGEQTGSSQTGDNYSQGTFNVNDILGMVVNQTTGAINYYKNGTYICTIRNSRGAGRRLYVAVSDWFFSASLACECLTSPSQYADRYLLPQ